MSKPTGAVYRVVLIEEGLGNLGDLSYYSRGALQFAADQKVFEGAQAFADHPTKLEDAIRPERSVRDLVGYYRNTAVETGENGTAELRADLCTLGGEEYDWVRSLIETALDVSGKFDTELVGFSINAGGGSEKKSIDNLLRDENLPVGVKPKLVTAQEQGAVEVDYLIELSEAVSCDLVTKAGARGRALKKLLESERTSKMSKKIKETAGLKKEGADAGHPDAAKDKELISSMMKKYMGDGDHSDEEMEAFKSAHEAYTEMGMDGEKAGEAAGNAMKLAKHVAGKKAAESTKKEDDMSAEAGAPAASDGGKMAKESEVTALKATVDGLQKQLRENAIASCISKTVSDSGYTGTAAKKLLESIQKSTSEKEIAEKAKIFKEALSLGTSDLFINPEKGGQYEGTPLSFEDCVQE